jgi:hypothetical protein
MYSAIKDYAVTSGSVKECTEMYSAIKTDKRAIL